jgi:hypothetical protein
MARAGDFQGSKRWFLAPPSDRNLEIYTEWAGEKHRAFKFLGIRLDEVFAVDLSEGQTMIVNYGALRR